MVDNREEAIVKEMKQVFYGKRNKQVKIATILFVVLLLGYTFYILNLDTFLDSQETVVLSSNSFAPGSESSMRVVVMDHATSQVMKSSDVKISLQKEGKGRRVVFEGKTDDHGTADIKFTAPEEEGEYEIIIETGSQAGTDTITKTIRIDRDYRILVTTDKPLYQPSQTMHIRALVLQNDNLHAAGNKEITIEVEEPKGNKVFKKIVDTNEYGIASADFVLADELNLGRYTIRAKMGDTSSEAKVDVDKYVLPKFKVELSTDKKYYLPGQDVKGNVRAGYFFGKDVQDANVNIRVSTFDVKLNEITNIQGKTDANGNFDFQFKLPEYFVGQPLEKGKGILLFNVSVIDKANHEEKISSSATIANDNIIIELVPESGSLVQGVENIVYVITSYPDGTPARATVTIKEQSYRGTGTQLAQLNTNEFGFGSFRITTLSNPRLTVTATDSQGNSATQTEYLQADYRNTVLLRTDKAIYNAGDTAYLNIFSSEDGTVYVDVIKNKQTMLTKALDTENKQAALALDLTENMFGTLQIHAYKISARGEVQRDTKSIVVNMPRDIPISIALSKDTYLPGEEAVINFDTGQQSAIGINIVDESVFALQDMQPGFEKIYFMLEAELMEPKYEIEFHLPEIVKNYTAPVDPIIPVPVARDEMAKMVLASASPTGFAIQENSYQSKVQNIEKAQKSHFELLTQLDTALLMLLSFAALAILALSFRKGFIKDAVITIPVYALTIFGSLILMMAAFIFYMMTLFIIGIMGVIAAAAVLIYYNKSNRPLYKTFILVGISLLLIVLLIPLSILSGSATALNNFYFNIAMFLLPFILLASGVHMALEKRKLSILAFLFFIVISPLFLLPTAGGMGALGDGMIGAIGAPMMLGAMRATGEMAQPMVDIAEETKAMPMAAMEGEKEPARIRQFFPETLYSNPALITDSQGRATLNLDMADSITTWRLTAMASTRDGKLGADTRGIRVFQDFFVDIDLPVALTQNDEISIPIAIYNYLPGDQSIRLMIAGDDWFELLDSQEKTVNMSSNDISVEYFRIRVRDIGTHKLTVFAYGSAMSDAISRSIDVLPDGKEVRYSVSDKLDTGIEKTVVIPEDAIDGANKIFVTIYPGIFSQVVDGLDSVLRMPNGCFEQTSSSTYPNVLVMDYMKKTNKITPEVQMKAEGYINTGYQRLLTFETSTPGGFDWWVNGNPQLLLSAFGLMEFYDMSKVYNIDSSIITRIQGYLVSNQDADGSWEPVGALHGGNERIKTSKMTATCYVTWALLSSDYDNDKTDNAISYIRDNINYKDEDSYTLALCANALAYKNQAQGALDELDSRKVEANGTVYWESSKRPGYGYRESFVGSRGKMLDSETTSLAAIAYMKASYASGTVNKILKRIVQQKDTFGTWSSTQATILSMKALIMSIEKTSEEANADIEVWINDQKASTIKITPANSDVLQLVDLEAYTKEGENRIEIRFTGDGNLFYQIVSRYYIPWTFMMYDVIPSAEKLISIEIAYDKTTLQQNDIVTSTVTVVHNGEGIARMMIIDLGIPPGFSVLSGDIDKLVADGTIARYSITGRQIIIYIDGLESKKPVIFSYRLQARYPIKAKTPQSEVYEYYNPDVRDTAEPIELVVN